MSNQPNDASWSVGTGSHQDAEWVVVCVNDSRILLSPNTAELMASNLLMATAMLKTLQDEDEQEQ